MPTFYRYHRPAGAGFRDIMGFFCCIFAIVCWLWCFYQLDLEIGDCNSPPSQIVEYFSQNQPNLLLAQLFYLLFRTKI